VFQFGLKVFELNFDPDIDWGYSSVVLYLGIPHEPGGF